MLADAFDERFFNTSRGRVITLLRRASRTVEELAQELSVTDNAIRAHLVALERDGLVQQDGVRRSIGKPAFIYRLTPKADQLFPKPYALVLNQLLDVLVAQIGNQQTESAMRELGIKIASGFPPSQGDARTRLQAAAAVLNQLGGLAEVQEQEGEFRIQGYSCPLAAVVPGHPQVCKLAESMLRQLTRASIQEQCNREEPWHCCFILKTSE